MRRRPCCWLLGATALLLPLPGCDASGSTQGGTPVTTDRCSDPNLGHTWTDLYTCYFGPSGKTSCVGQNFCHGAPDQTGALYPNSWICGTTRESCWRGMTQGQVVCPDGGALQASPDAGGEAGALDAASESGASDAGPGADGGEGGTMEAGAPTCMFSSQPLVPVDAGDPNATLLWPALRGASGVGLHNMPYSAPSTAGVTFTQQDLDRISAWIREGAKDN